VISADDVEGLLALGHELRAFEVKGPGALRDRAFCAKVARAAMAMGNLRDGGIVCIGVDKSDLARMQPGLTDEQLASWSDHDEVSTQLSRFSDPALILATIPLTLSNGARIVALEVGEFDVVPYICTRDYLDETRAGALYVRPRGMPKSVHVPTSIDMRDLVDLATSKGVREFIRRAGQAGMLTLSAEAGPGQDELFGAERMRAWSEPSAWAPDLEGLARFDVAIRPLPFDPRRIPPVRLDEVIERATVRLRGWPVPMFSRTEAVKRLGDRIGQDASARPVRRAEAWWLCSSGQFLQRRALTTEFTSAAEFRQTVADATGTVAIWDVLFYAVEVCELAARLASDLECDAISVSFALVNVAGRELVTGTWERELNDVYLQHAATLEAVADVSTVDLLADPRAVAVAMTEDILGRWGLRLPTQVLSEWQAQFLRS
jgi:hypothetical protein